MPNNDYSHYMNILESRLIPKRYYHSLCVADEAFRLAEKYNADAETAYLSGLLHDITKNATSEEHLNIFNKFGIMLNNVEKNTEKLWHAISGAEYIRGVLGVSDPQIYDAVRYHTTAKADMPLLSKILYLADFTSADRDYDDVDTMRRLVDVSLDDAYAYALAYTVTDLVSTRRAIHPDTIAAYNEVCLKGSNFSGC